MPFVPGPPPPPFPPPPDVAGPVDAAKKELEPKGMTVVQGNIDAFRKVAQEKIWPSYKQQYGALWDEIEGVKA